MKDLSVIHSDVQAQQHKDLQSIEWVGMGQIQSAIQVGDLTVPALLDLGVNLKSGYRGIHMSRLYKVQLEHFLQKKLNTESIYTFLDKALATQEDLSSEVSAKIQFQFPLETLSLKSNSKGYRNYPVQIIAVKSANKDLQFWLRFEVLYSSTCPQSAGLSMELFRAAADKNPDRLPATPHAQRSRAEVSVLVSHYDESFLASLILHVEDNLQTPVQTAVKKADEMEFAKRNAENLMFCEDAVRKLANCLSEHAGISGFCIFCEHQESLHPHNASSFIKKNWAMPENIRFC